MRLYPLLEAVHDMLVAVPRTVAFRFYATRHTGHHGEDEIKFEVPYRRGVAEDRTRASGKRDGLAMKAPQPCELRRVGLDLSCPRRGIDNLVSNPPRRFVEILRRE